MAWNWGEPEGEVLKPTALGDPQHEETGVEPGIAPEASAGGVSTHVTNYGGQGSLAPGGHVAVRESGFDQRPPLLSSLEGGGQDPELLAKPVLISAADFPTAEAAARSACDKVANFFRHPLASFLQMASYGGQTVVVDSVLATTCAAAQ